MNYLDRLLKISPEQAERESTGYRAIHLGARTSLVGLASMIGGSAAASLLGIEVGGDLALAGALELGIGGYMMIAGSVSLDLEQS